MLDATLDAHAIEDLACLIQIVKDWSNLPTTEREALGASRRLAARLVRRHLTILLANPPTEADVALVLDSVQ